MITKNSLLTIKHLLWHQAIKTIESHNGSGVATYFKFLRWLLFLNIFYCILRYNLSCLYLKTSKYTIHCPYNIYVKILDKKKL